MGKISLRIADLRKKNRVTQQELADCIGVSFQTISKWETGLSMPTFLFHRFGRLINRT